MGTAVAEWAPGGGALALRVDATYGQRPRDESMLFPPEIPCVPGGPCHGPLIDRTTTRTYGATAGPRWALAPRGPLHPYLFGGVGAFRTTVKTTRTVTYSCPIDMLCSATDQQFTLDHQSWWRATLDAGAGLAVRAGPIALVGEARYLLADDTRAKGVRGIVPVMFGVRF
jgi:opacity protein-like surface antigen